MEILIGLCIIVLGSMMQSSSYVPIKKVKNWSWESFWLVQGVFAWLIFPGLVTIYLISDLNEFWYILSQNAYTTLTTIFFGILWGVGNLTFGLSMRYLGIALGQSVALGTCSAFGTIIPALMKGENFLDPSGIIILFAVSVSIMGIAIISYAGHLKSKKLTEKERKEEIKDFAFKKGIFVAILAGVMSACFSLGLETGISLKVAFLKLGINKLYAGLRVVLLITLGGFISNGAYCLFQNFKNKTISDYWKIDKSLLLNNVAFSALAGFLWYSQFIGFEAGKEYLNKSELMLLLSWSILLSLNIIFSNVWGVILSEWKGVDKRVILVLCTGLLFLIISFVLPAIL